MNRSRRSSAELNDLRHVEPKTVPPPAGAKDMYSAQTRVGSLPEDVLAAMRAEETDAALAARTRSGTRPAVRPPPPLLPPLPRARLSPETPDPVSAVRPRSHPPSGSGAAQTHHDDSRVSMFPSAVVPIRPSASPPRWSGTPARASLPPSPAAPLFIQSLAPTSAFDGIEEMPPSQSSLLRSVAIVVLFAFLGAIVACAIMFDVT